MKLSELHEAKSTALMTDKAEIIAWLKKREWKGTHDWDEIVEVVNGEVNLAGSLHLRNNVGVIPFKLNDVDGGILIKGVAQKSIPMLPRTVASNAVVVIEESPKLTNLDGFEIKECYKFDVSFTDLRSFKNFPKCTQLEMKGCVNLDFKDIHKYVECKSIFFTSTIKRSGLLDVMRIPGIEEIIGIGRVPETDDEKRYSQALGIVYKNHKNGKKGIIEAQSAMIDNDLEEFM